MFDCIVTGIWLIDPESGCWPADLFQQGDVYIINANMNGDGTGRPGLRNITLTGEYWMRRGVYVVNREDTTLSKAANEYIGN